jgi:hypothetical protein
VKDGGRVALTSTGSTSFDFTRISDINSVFSVLRPTDFTTSRNSFILGDTVNSDYHSDYNGGWLGANSAATVRNGANYLNGSSVTLTGLTRSAGQYVLSMIHTANTARANAISQDRNAQYGQRSWIGNRQELIIYSDDRTTNRASIESNVGDYFTQNTPLLDTYTGAAACYSLRLMRTAYTGSAIRVRRSSDSTEQDIGFNVFGELDTVSLLAFAGTGDAFVKTWYDQSGNSNDATQTTTASQPQIVSSGAVIVNSNGKPALKEVNLSGFTTTFSSGTNAWTVSAVFEDITRASGGYSNVFYGSQRMQPAQANGTVILRISSNASLTGTDNAPNAVIWQHDAGTSEYSINGGSTGTASIGNANFSATIGRVGAADMAEFINEIVLWPSKLDDFSGVYNNLNAFYSIN